MDLAQLLQESAVQELRAKVQKMSPELRTAFLKQYFSPDIVPPPETSWFQSDQDAYREQLRRQVYAIQDA